MQEIEVVPIAAMPILIYQPFAPLEPGTTVNAGLSAQTVRLFQGTCLHAFHASVELQGVVLPITSAGGAVVFNFIGQQQPWGIFDPTEGFLRIARVTMLVPSSDPNTDFRVVTFWHRLFGVPACPRAPIASQVLHMRDLRQEQIHVAVKNNATTSLFKFSWIKLPSRVGPPEDLFFQVSEFPVAYA